MHHVVRGSHISAGNLILVLPGGGLRSSVFLENSTLDKVGESCVYRVTRGENIGNLPKLANKYNSP